MMTYLINKWDDTQTIDNLMKKFVMIYIYEWACSEDTRYKENEEDIKWRNYNEETRIN